MKSLFLVGIAQPEVARIVLGRLLPGQKDPWLLLSAEGDPIAYFNIGPDDDDSEVMTIQADVSGRHYDEDDAVRKVLGQIAATVGGRIEDDL